MFAWDAYGKSDWPKCNSVVGGKWLEENVLRTFVYVFLILVPVQFTEAPAVRKRARDPTVLPMSCLDSLGTSHYLSVVQINICR